MEDRILARKLDVATDENESEPTLSAEDRFATIVEVLVNYPDVTVGTPGKKGFGSSALQVGGKIFAMINSKGRFVVKLPRQRVDALIAAGEGEHFDPGHGRVMKEWLTLEPTTQEQWLSLAREAMDFVASKR